MSMKELFEGVLTARWDDQVAKEKVAEFVELVKRKRKSIVGLGVNAYPIHQDVSNEINEVLEFELQWLDGLKLSCLNTPEPEYMVRPYRVKDDVDLEESTYGLLYASHQMFDFLYGHREGMLVHRDGQNYLYVSLELLNEHDIIVEAMPDERYENSVEVCLYEYEPAYGAEYVDSGKPICSIQRRGDPTFEFIITAVETLKPYLQNLPE